MNGDPLWREPARPRRLRPPGVSLGTQRVLHPAVWIPTAIIILLAWINRTMP